MDDARRFMFGDQVDRAIVMAKHRRFMEQHGGGRVQAIDGREWWHLPEPLVEQLGCMALRVW